MHHLIQYAINKGAKVYGSVSGGKDGQAMVKSWIDNGNVFEGLIHADLGRVEWEQSLPMCYKLAEEANTILHVVKRADGRGMLEHWSHRLQQLKGTGKPFWSSSSNRYCTSDLKRDPINKFLTNCGNDFIISLEGIRAEESLARGKKSPLEIRDRITSSFYNGMSVEQAIANFTPGKRLALTYYPIFNFTVVDVWATYGLNESNLSTARLLFKEGGEIVNWWAFHPAYVMGNERVSCKFCILGALNDLQVAAKDDVELLDIMIAMEKEGGSTFKNKWSLEELKK